MGNIIIENEMFRLELSPECVTASLFCKKTGEECLETGTGIPLFSLTEERPYNNEIKLAHPNKRTTFNANRVRREEKRLIVGFELVTFERLSESEPLVFYYRQLFVILFSIVKLLQFFYLICCKK